jgi:HlyD family secretion protein
MNKITRAVTSISFLALSLFMFAGCKNEAAQFITDKVTRGDIITAVTATGTINAVTSVNVGAQISGQITKLYVDFNSPVKKGQLLALIDPALTQAQVDQARATLANAKANVEKATATEVDAKRTWDRYKNLFARDLVAKSLLDAAETAYLTDHASTVAAKTQVDLSQAALNQALTNLVYTKIVSPVDGVVVSRNIDVGQTVASSFQTPTLFLIAKDLTKMQIDTSVDEADVSNVKVGQDVDFQQDAYPDVTFKGKVLQVREASAILQNVVTYDVVVQVDNKDLRLMPGMTAQVSIITSVVRNVLRIPNGALRFRPMQNGKPVAPARGPGIWTLENNKLKRIPVKIGFSDGTYTELVSGDVKEGEIMIIDSLSKPSSQTTGFRMF